MEALLNSILLCLLLFLGDVTSYTLLCNTASPCPTTVNCPVNQDCTITCNQDGCRSITINCPPSGSCDITCFDQRACDGGTQIIGSTGSLLTVNANANSAFYDGIILCGSQGTCNLNCNAQDACRQVTVDGRGQKNTDVTLAAIGTNAFLDGFIYGAENGQMTVTCEKQGACRNALIKAHTLSTFLNIIAEPSDYGILEETNIYCPDNGGNKAPTCQITCASNGCLRTATVYAVESFHDVGIYCADGSGSPCNNNNDLPGLTLKCKTDYSSSCSMQLDPGTYDEMHCSPLSAVCETYELAGTSEPTTSQPTTKNPTTSQPTTKSPITSQPTTSNPTSPPTTSNPTTSQPTPNIPTTSAPTTNNPTTNEPTTIEPTTIEPTTSDPLTPTTITSTPTTITNSPTMTTLTPTERPSLKLDPTDRITFTPTTSDGQIVDMTSTLQTIVYIIEFTIDENLEEEEIENVIKNALIDYDYDNVQIVSISGKENIQIELSTTDEDLNSNIIEKEVEDEFENEYDIKIDVTVTTPNDKHNEQTHEKSSYNFFLITLIIFMICLIILIAAYIHSHCILRNDYFRMAALATAAIHFLDTSSDIFFAWNIKNNIMLIFAIIFIVIPILLTLFQLHRSIKNWRRFDELAAWLGENVTFLYIISAVFGSAFAGIAICTSNAFSVSKTDFPLNKTQLNKFKAKRLFSTVLIENVPQLLLQIIVLVISDQLNDIVYVSMIFSLLSIIISVFSLYEQRGLVQRTEYVSIEFDVKGSIIISKIQKYKNRTLILRNQIAALLGIDKNLIEITRSKEIPRGLRIHINCYINNTKAIDMSIEKNMNKHKNSGELAEVMKLCWNLPSVPTIQNIKYQKHESKLRRANTVLIPNISTESNVNFNRMHNNGSISQNNNNGSIQMQMMSKVASISVNNEKNVINAALPARINTPPGNTAGELQIISTPPVIVYEGNEIEGNQTGFITDNNEPEIIYDDCVSAYGNTDGYEKDKIRQNDVEKWLKYKVKLPQYKNEFIENGYDSLDIIAAITDEEQLKEIGIELQGHIKKIMIEIKKIKL